MSEIVNLDKARKSRVRRASQATAAENRVRHGRTKAATRREEAERQRARAELDAHEIERDENR